MNKTNEDRAMTMDRLQAEYQEFLSELQQKGFCDEQGRAKLLEYFDKADKLE